MKFVTNYELQRHLIKIHTVSPTQGHSCDRDDCLFVAQTKKILKRHICKDHPKFQCSKCGHKFVKQESLDRHVSFHSSMTITSSDGSWFKMDLPPSKDRKGPKTYRCLLCSYSSTKQSNFKSHQWRVHQRQKQIKEKHAPKQCRNFCGYSSRSKFLVERHEKKCTWSGPGKITIEDVINIVCVTGCSFTDTSTILRLIRERFGRCAVEPNLLKRISQMVADLAVWFSDEFIELHDKKGDPVKTCVSYIRYLKDFREWVARGRGIVNPRFTYAMDGGQGKFVIVLVIHDEDKPGDRNANGHLATGCRLTIPILQCDFGKRVPENRYNVEKLCGLVEFPDENTFSMTSDLKGVNIVTGLGGCTGLHFCSNGTCYKVDAKTGEKTNKRGLVVKGEDRLVRFQVDQNKLFEGEGKGNKLKMSRY